MSDARRLSDLVVSVPVDTASAANTAAASTPAGAWVDTRNMIGDIAVIAIVGGVTAGSITGQIQEADDINGTNAQAIASGGAFTQLTAAGKQNVCVDRTALRKPFVGYAGTVVTGPVTNFTVLVIGRAQAV